MKRLVAAAEPGPASERIGREAVGRWLRDRQVEGFTEDEVEARWRFRATNEALHRPVKRLPFEPVW